jgi:hypothetical protein
MGFANHLVPPTGKREGAETVFRRASRIAGTKSTPAKNGGMKACGKKKCGDRERL